jgi:pilus assembly protein Flp/PilA
MLPILVTLQYVADAKNSIVDRLTGEQKGATAVEYGLLVGLVAIVVVVALVGLRQPLADLVGRIGTYIGTVA